MTEPEPHASSNPFKLSQFAEIAGVVAVVGLFAQAAAQLAATSFYASFGVSPSDIGLDPFGALTQMTRTFLAVVAVGFLATCLIGLLPSPRIGVQGRDKFYAALVALFACFALVIFFSYIGKEAGIKAVEGADQWWNPISQDLNPAKATVRWTKPDERPLIPDVPAGWTTRHVSYLGVGDSLSYLWDLDTKRMIIVSSSQVQLVLDPD